MIGLCVSGRPVLGVVFAPVTGRLYAAAPGAGAVVEDAAGVRPLACSAVAEPARMRLISSASHRSALIDEVRRALGIDDEQRLGSVGAKLGLIAAGERDLYVNPSDRSKAWDTCAPEAILAAAGGRMTDLDGEPLRYDLPDLRNRRGLLASNGRAHDEIVRRLAPLLAA